MGAELLFREKDHVYMLGGNMIPSVSDLCVPLQNGMYKDVPKWQLESAVVIKVSHLLLSASKKNIFPMLRHTETF